MTRAPSRPEPTTAAGAPEQTDSRFLLSHAVEEVARLLQADGAMVYLADDGMMRFAVDAGIRNPEAQQLIRDLSLPIGVGIFGHAAATGELVVSGDYRRDRRFPHSPVADRIVQVANMRSMAAAPLIADGEVLGALGAYSSRIDAFDEAGLALLRALADHAATAIANQRLIERLARSQAELARRVDTQRTLGEIAARIAVIREPEVVLRKVVDAARRLIGSDAAHLTLMLPGGKLLRPTVVVGGNAAWTEDWLAQLDFPVDGGINGLAAGSGEAVWTEDYLVDPRIPHDEGDQEVARRLQLRGMAAAPLRGPQGEVIGTLAVSFERQHAFGADELELLQGLADQGAIAIANARLTEDLRQHGDELAHRVDAQRTLAEMAAQLTSLRDPSAVLIQTLNAAVRLLKGRGGQIGMVVTDSDGVLRWGDGHSLVHGRLVPFTKEDHTKVDDGVSGRSVREGRVSWTDDYLPDTSFPHDPASDRVARKLGIRAVIAAPLIGEGGPVGAIGVYAEEPSAFDADDGELLGLLAGQAVIVLTNARLNAEAEVAAAKLAHRVEAQRTLGEIAASITSLRDPSAVLRRTIDEARRLLDADHVVIHQVRPGSRELADYREVFSPGPDATSPEAVTVNIGQGIAGRAIEERTVTWTGDYLADRTFQHTDRADEWIGRFAYRSQMSAPLIGEEGPIGAISAYSTRPDAFDTDDSQLLGTLASQAAIVLGNARLYEELERRIEAQRSLGAIAARITAIRDPGDVLQRTLDEAVRLLDADGGRIELVAEGGGLHWAFGHSAIDLPIERQAGEADVSAEEGVSGRAVQQRRVVLTGDYLADESFVHAEAPDRYIRQHGIRSVMSAPLIAEEGAIGSLTVHSQAREAFDPADAELIEVLASQAAIAVTNARLYEELEKSERRYRHLVDNSPDIVWSVDAEGRFTFFSDSLESRTGWKPEHLLGQPFTALAGAETLGAAAEAWELLREDPTLERRVRLDLPLADGRISQTEVAMTGTMVDGRFAGAHGSVRDISERERLEGDLRGQAAELAASQERAHLARELHDSVTQALFSMGLTLRTLELLLPTDPKAASEKVAELRELQKDALAEMRTLIFELRPTSLESDGLVQALRTHATAVQRRTGLAIVVDAEPIERLPISTEEALYRIGQEALHNVVKHANASHATIRIVREGDQVRLSVTDDGAGFQPGEVPRGHLGLIGMRQRVDLVGGELRVESKPGRGTVVEASVPGDEEPSAE